MQYAAELFFDSETEKKIFALARKAAEQSGSEKYLEWKTRPHITLACFNDVDEAECARRLGEFAVNHDIMPAYIGSVGMFTDTGTVFLSPVMNRSMYALQNELHAAMSGFDTSGWEWYLPDRWVPHCAVALTAGEQREIFYKACDAVLRGFGKMSGKFTSVGLVKISFPVEEIAVFDLRG